MNWKKLWLTAATAALITAVVPAMAQTPTMTGSIHGHVNDPTGAPITNGIISLSPEGTTNVKYTFNTDANGDYKGAKVAVGDYAVSLREPTTAKGQVIDSSDNVRIMGGQDTTQNFDLSRAAYIAHLTQAQREQIAKVKKENAGILKQNAQIKNLNGDLLEARKDNQAKNYAAADTLMTKDTSVLPTAYLLWVELGTAQLGEKKYDAAIASLNKAITIDESGKKPNLQVAGVAGNVLGEAYGDSGKFQQADAAYAASAKADPKSAGMYYTNEAIVMSRNNQTDMTVKAADAAIAANPSDPTPYYLKGQALLNKATTDSKGNVIAPPGCAEAYQKYLQLAPTGQFAGDVKAILQSLGHTGK